MPGIDYDNESVTSETESQTRRLHNTSIDTWGDIEDTLKSCCGNKITKVLMDHKAMWICIILSIIYYAIGIAYYSTTEGWGLIENIYFITVGLLAIGYGYVVPLLMTQEFLLLFISLVELF